MDKAAPSQPHPLLTRSRSSFRSRCVNEETRSWTEDAISAWRSSNVTIRQGVVDGNNSPHGVGIMFEGSESATHGGLIEDVDAIHQGGASTWQESAARHQRLAIWTER